MWKILYSVVVLAVSPVGKTIASDGLAQALSTPPSGWSDADRDSFTGSGGFLTLCRLHQSRTYGFEMDKTDFSKADIKAVEAELMKRGVSAFDIVILRDRTEGQVSIGQSFAGLVCEMRRPIRVNKSFSQGLGHRWQVILPGQFIYLEGNGTPAGMKVTGWN